MAKRKIVAQVVPSNVRQFPRLKLVEPYVDSETVSCLSQLLEMAREGKVIGIAFGVAFKDEHFIVDVAGECRRSRFTARALVADLNDTLSRN